MEWTTVERAIKTEIRHKNSIKRVGKLGYVKNINHNIPTTWRWAWGTCSEYECFSLCVCVQHDCWPESKVSYQNNICSVTNELWKKNTCKVESRNVSVTAQCGDGLRAESIQALVQAIHLPTRGSQIILVRHWGSHLNVIFLQKGSQLVYNGSKQGTTHQTLKKKQNVV